MSDDRIRHENLAKIASEPRPQLPEGTDDGAVDIVVERSGAVDAEAPWTN